MQPVERRPLSHPISARTVAGLGAALSLVSVAAAGGPPIAAWEATWQAAPGEWALADLTVVGPGGETYISTRPQVGGGNGSGLLKYSADGTLEWEIVREEVPDGSEGFTDLEITDEGIALVGVTLDSESGAQTLLLNYAANGTLLWETRSIGSAIPGFLQPQLAIGPAQERVVASDDGNGFGVLERYDAAGRLLDARELTFSGFGGVSAMEVDAAGAAVLVVLNDFTTYSVQKYDPEGDLLWSYDESGEGLALSEAFMAIDTTTGDIVTTGSMEVVSKGELQVVSRIWRLDPDGAVQWTVNSDIDFAISTDLVLGHDGAAYVSRNTSFGKSELVRIDASGAESWTRTYEGKDHQTSFSALAIGAGGDVFVGGHDSQSTSFIGVRVLRYDPAGVLGWTARVVEEPGQAFFLGDLQAGPGGSIALALTQRDDPIFDLAVTVHLTFAPCTGDLDGTGDVGLADLLTLLAAWGEVDHPADFDGSGEVGLGDLLTLLAAWGPCD